MVQHSPLSLAELTADSFAGRLCESFAVTAPGVALQLVLAEIDRHGTSHQREAFSLRFMGPAQPILPQAIYRLENPAVGAMEIFLVPLGPQRDGMRYEAVFT